MTSSKFRLLNALMLSVLFALTLLSIGLSAHGISKQMLYFHMISGSLLMAASMAHLALHLPWIRSMFLRRVKTLSPEARRNRRVDVSLIIIGFACAVSGWLQFLFPAPVWHRMHAAGGFLMIILLVIHLLLHRRWMVNQIRCIFTGYTTRQRNSG
ncbi:MAG: hypothetical protein LWX83_14175 [Anaerolineae bacterium]|nr:hypothetical protein [Anaerolineae bacterium]